ncbi:MAG: prepilin-type N-terminal cleavage/methylation domain-containing protein [Eubacteriales bacterium]
MIFKDKRGLTLVEVVVAIGILSIIGLVVANMLTTGMKTRNLSRERLQALSVGTSYIDEIKANVSKKTVTDVAAYLTSSGVDFTYNNAESRYEKVKKDNNNNKYDINIFLQENVTTPGGITLRVEVISQQIDKKPVIIPTIFKE